MRNDFAVFILTHGRADNVVTVPAIKKAGYTGKIYFIIDDEDEQAEEYKKNFGADRVIIFDKQAAYDRADTMDNFNDHRAIIYARNECWRIAEELGLKYFLMLDDDYKSIDYRYEEDGKNHPDILERVKYTGGTANPAIVNEQVLAQVLVKVFEVMQMPEEDAVKEIAGIEDENILITIHATESREAVKAAAKSRAVELSTGGKKKAATGGKKSTKGNAEDKAKDTAEK